MKHKPAAKVLTLFEVSERLRLSKKTTVDLLIAGRLPGVKLGKQWRVSEDALNETLRGGHVRIGQGAIRPAA